MGKITVGQSLGDRLCLTKLVLRKPLSPLYVGSWPCTHKLFGRLVSTIIDLFQVQVLNMCNPSFARLAGFERHLEVSFVL